MQAATFAALGGVFAASRLASSSQQAGTGDVNLNAIAAAVIGGTSLFGGRGSILGMFFGAVPGLSGLVGMAILLPFTFDMDPYSAFAVMMGTFLLSLPWATADGVLRWHFVAAKRIKQADLLSPRFIWMASKESDEFTSACPASATVMSRSLRGTAQPA